MVDCGPSDDELSYQERPVLIVEVLSDNTRRIDESENLAAYASLPSLQVHLLVEPSDACIRADLRESGDFN